MVDFILNIKYAEGLNLVLGLTVFLAILFTLFYIIMHTEKVIRMIIPNAFGDKIEVVNLFTERKNTKMPVEEIDVRWFLQEALKTHSTELKGIKRVYLTERPIDVPKNLLAKYSPHTKEGPIIQLFPMKYDNENKNFYLKLDDENKTGYTDREAKETLLFSLGQELGRHHLYKTTQILDSKNAEVYTERFATGLKIVKDYLRVGTIYSKSSNNHRINSASEDEYRS